MKNSAAKTIGELNALLELLRQAEDLSTSSRPQRNLLPRLAGICIGARIRCETLIHDLHTEVTREARQ